MSGWRAIVPFRPAEAGGTGAKTRLAGHLDVATRAALATTMARHVLETLGRCPLIVSIGVLSPMRPPFTPAGIDWIADRGLGLNPELSAAMAASEAGRLLVIHADMPLLGADDIAALLDSAASAGAAIAPDHARTGTNALALTDARGFVPVFGPGSLALHRALLPHAALVERPGLALDIDTPADFERALDAGMRVDGTRIASPI